MSGRLRLALVLEFGDPVTGAVLEPDGKPHDFEGWVEMHSILEAIHQQGRGRPASPRDETVEK